jgi:archaellum component FlaG (FlaF/FlaG flagellin family)
MRSTRLLLAVYGAVALFLCGCNYVVLENPLPTVLDNRIVGSWATPDGKLYAVIKSGDNSSYQSLTADDITKNGKGTTFYLANVGRTLLTENPSACSGFLFAAPSATDAPSGCWTITRVVLSDNSLEYDNFDTTLMLQKSVGGGLRDVSLKFGASVSKGASSDAASSISTDVLIEGKPDEVAPFLATYTSGQVYTGAVLLHRI